MRAMEGGAEVASTMARAVQENMTYHLISIFEPEQGQDIGEFLVGEGVVTLPKPNKASILFDQWFTDLFFCIQRK